jgi:ribosome-associated protein
MQISRSEQKRRIKEVERLVAELVRLPLHIINQAPVSEEFKQLLLATVLLEGAVQQRQIKYLTKLVQEQPVEQLYDLVGRHHGKHLAAQKELHALEFYRDALINEALEQQANCRSNSRTLEENWVSVTLAEMQSHFPELEPLVLSRLACLFSRTRNPRYSREIFRYLRSLHERQQRKAAG